MRDGAEGVQYNADVDFSIFFGGTLTFDVVSQSLQQGGFGALI